MGPGQAWVGGTEVSPPPRPEPPPNRGLLVPTRTARRGLRAAAPGKVRAALGRLLPPGPRPLLLLSARSAAPTPPTSSSSVRPVVGLQALPVQVTLWAEPVGLGQVTCPCSGRLLVGERWRHSWPMCGHVTPHLKSLGIVTPQGPVAAAPWTPTLVPTPRLAAPAPQRLPQDRPQRSPSAVRPSEPSSPHTQPSRDPPRPWTWVPGQGPRPGAGTRRPPPFPPAPPVPSSGGREGPWFWGGVFSVKMGCAAVAAARGPGWGSRARSSGPHLPAPPLWPEVRPCPESWPPSLPSGLASGRPQAPPPGSQPRPTGGGGGAGGGGVVRLGWWGIWGQASPGWGKGAFLLP